MAKKLFTKVMIAVLLLSMLMAMAACGGGSDTTKKTGTTVTPEQIPSQIEGMKDSTDGTTVQFLYVEGGNGTYTADSIWVDPESGILDDVDQAVIERNNKVSDALGVEIKLLEGTEALGIADLQGYAKVYFDVQDPEMDVYCGYQYFDLSLATQAHLYNLNDLVNDNGDKIIDIEQDYWATNYIKSITYNDYLYWVTGDLALRYTGGLYCTFVNKDLYDMYVKGKYENRSIYQVVEDGDWHMQTMLDMASLAYEDTDKSGALSEEERIGIVFETCDVMDGYAFGCQVEFGKKVPNASTGKEEITITVGTDSKASSLASFLYTMSSSIYSYNGGSNDSKTQMPIFANGNTLFALNKINMATIYLYDMDNFGIIPPPKLNKEQTNYATGVHDSLTIFGISKYSDCPEAAAATLELMAYFGSKLVTPTYVTNVVEGTRTATDDESVTMINKYIRPGFNTDFVAAWSNSIDNVVHVFRDPSNLKQYSAYINVTSKKWPSLLNQLTAQLEDAALEQ